MSLISGMAGLAACALLLAGPPGAVAVVGGEEIGVGPAVPTSPPNLIVIQTDDQTHDDLYAEMRDADGVRAPAMPATRNLIGRRGITFGRYYATY
ncbi:MAG TPA: hypothetical protein VFD37_06750, partial [Solirubrobacterales bacterium]|nr:hypothetical protein [Solirubrobacterales bacterium]